MQIRTLTNVLALAALASAAPRPANTPLQWNDVVLVGRDGAHQLIKDYEYADLTRRGILAPPAPPASAGPLTKRAPSSSSSNKRACPKSEEVQVTSDTEFTGWDVAISPVVGSTGGQVLASVAQGFSLANKISATVTISAGVEDVVKTSLAITYAKEWTTTETSTISYIMPEGQQYGVVVSQPLTRRIEGNLITGCSDDPTVDAYTSDSFTDEQYGSLSWVRGAVRLCNATVYPVPFCNGEGFHE